MSKTRKQYSNGDSFCSVCKDLREEKYAQERKKDRKINHKKWSYIYKRDSLKRLYGITVEEYETILNQQNGQCALCKALPGKRSLHVDHNHKTGKIRGLLCHHCNTALGLLREDPDLIFKLINYLGKQ